MIKVEDVYPISVTTYPDGATSMKYITDNNLKDYTRPKDVDSLNHFLNGQTRYLAGVYASDVERWLNKQPVID